MLSELRIELKEIKAAIKAGLFSSESNLREPTPKEILGFDLYPEQEKWLEFLYSNLDGTKEKPIVIMLEGARDYGKSDVGIVYGLTKFIINNPNKTVLLGSRDRGRSMGMIEPAAAFFKSCKIKGKFNQASIKFKDTKGKQPNLKIISTSQTSIHGNHTDLAILDDIVVGEDEFSLANREKAKRFYKALLNVTKNIILIANKVHKDDLYAMLEELHQEELEKNKDNIFYVPEIRIMRSFYGSIPELDKSMEALKGKGLSDADISKYYYGEILPSEMYPFSSIPAKQFRFGTTTEACIDPAFGGEDFVGVAIAVQKGDKYYCLVKKFGHNIHDEKQNIITYLKQNNVTRCYVERNDGGGREVGGLVRSLRDADNEINFRAYKTSKYNKHNRILNDIGLHKENIVLSTYGDYLEIQDFTTDLPHDDVPDALAYLLNFLSGNRRKIEVL